MIVTTTPTVEGRPVKDYLGIVSGEVVLDDGSFAQNAYLEETVASSRQRALRRMTKQAQDLGANAVVGVTVDLEVHAHIRYLQVTGTAVFIP